MDQRCGSCKYLRFVLNEQPEAHFDHMCKFTNELVDIFEDGGDCTTYVSIIKGNNERD